MLEYSDFAKYYDLFYQNKDYNKEVDFLNFLIKNKKTVLDLGCGTGIHMQILENECYQVDGLDLSDNMLSIARSRVKGSLYQANILDFKLNKKYDAIISMFAVFNHLNSYEEFEQGLLNAYQHLNDLGILIIDLHNGRESGEKINIKENYQRIMKWHFDSNNFKEYTDITYVIDNKEYHTTHTFMIYEIDKIKKILDKNNLEYKILENYTFKEASDNSKNIEIIIYKS